MRSILASTERSWYTGLSYGRRRVSIANCCWARSSICGWGPSPSAWAAVWPADRRRVALLPVARKMNVAYEVHAIAGGNRHVAEGGRIGGASRGGKRETRHDGHEERDAAHCDRGRPPSGAS